MSTISVNTVKQFSGTSVTVASNLKVSGSTEMSGNVIVGNATSDTIKFNSVVSSSVVPHTHNAFNLGSSAKKWANIYVQTMNIQQVNNPSGSVVLSGSATGSCWSGTEAINLNGATQVKGCLYENCIRIISPRLLLCTFTIDHLWCEADFRVHCYVLTCCA